jgi:hypothetical protein
MSSTSISIGGEQGVAMMICAVVKIKPSKAGIFAAISCLVNLSSSSPGHKDGRRLGRI